MVTNAGGLKTEEEVTVAKYVNALKKQKYQLYRVKYGVFYNLQPKTSSSSKRKNKIHPAKALSEAKSNSRSASLKK